MGLEESAANAVNVRDYSLHRKVGLNTAWLTAARLGSQLLLLVFSMLVARRMGEEGLGSYAYLGAVIFIGNVLTTFGTDMLVMREVAANRDFSWLAPSTVLQLILSGLCVGSIFLFSLPVAGNDPQLAAALRLYSLALLPLAIFTVCSAVLRGLELMRPYMWLVLLPAGFQAGLALVVLHPGSSILDLGWILLTVQTSAALLAFGYTRFRISGFTLFNKFPLSRLFILLAASLPLATIAIVKILYQKISLLLLSYLQGLSDTGWFSAALRLVEASQFIHIAMLGALFPLMALVSVRLRDTSVEEVKVLASSWKLLLALGVAAAAVLYFFSGIIIALVYGKQFLPSVQALRILAWLMIPYSVNLYLSAQLITARQERRLLSVLFSSLLALIGLDLVLIPAYGLAGACAATVAAECFQAVLFLASRYSIRFTSHPASPA